ncbi:hypothetical protein [Acinetobacter seifertii]|uniref:hypothetical protein n=1 Tax=Acinetobacter seifertii TaxID=1530123 RepID=UPI000C1E3E48|nr:hypothetical protein [Acinetobacter seifertii]PJF04221.1 hypothetical protein CVD06_08155 [Acinetobacter seifertii]PJG68605.1 hypothetical protein CVD08_19100 [Acinetobacter seifertii]
MRELTLNEFDMVSGGMTWQDRRESENIGWTQYVNGQPVYVDYYNKGVCEPVPDISGNNYCADGGDY